MSQGSQKLKLGYCSYDVLPPLTGGTMKKIYESTAPGVSRRSVLQTSAAAGGFLIGGTAVSGGVAANEGADLIDVSPTSLKLKEYETSEVEVEIRGPPFGRTDVEVTAVPADPEEFRLSGRGDSETVKLGPLKEDSVAEFHAATPRGDEQLVKIEIEVEPLEESDIELTDLEFWLEKGEAHFRWSIGGPIDPDEWTMGLIAEYDSPDSTVSGTAHVDVPASDESAVIEIDDRVDECWYGDGRFYLKSPDHIDIDRIEEEAFHDRPDRC